MTAYEQTNFVNDNTAITADVLNKRETGIQAAHQEILDFKMAGMISAFPTATAPTGWVKCNGQAVSRTTYAVLYGVIGTTYGTGDNSTTFNVPDLRGVFVRVLDDGAGYDSGRALGSYQADQDKAHAHGYTDLEKSTSDHNTSGYGGVSSGNTWTTGNVSGSNGGDGRPKNYSVCYYIKC